MATATRERFLAKTRRRPSGCLEWTGATSDRGYGVVRRGGKLVKAHRWFYEQEVGPIPDGMELRHTCDNPPCVEVTHLVPGTHAENMRDMIERGRHINQQVTHCPKDHPYDEENTYYYRGHRQCRECVRQANRESRARRKAG